MNQSNLKIFDSSRILISKMYHRRNLPKKHEFSYSIFYLRIRLKTLEKLNTGLRTLKYNKFSLFSLWDKDYLSCYYGNLEEKLDCLFGELKIPSTFDYIDLITHPRIFGYAFNPVSFFICARQNKAEVLISEVHNTFGERHLYVCTNQGEERRGETLVSSFSAKKDFHVSPFFEKKGTYEFKLIEKKNSTSVIINLIQDGKLVFESGIVGREKELTDLNLLKSLISYPGSIALTIFRISYHAAILKFIKGMEVITKPIATSRMTFQKSAPSFLQKLSKNTFFNYLSKAKDGSISLTFPSGEKYFFGDPQRKSICNIKVLNYDLFLRSVFSGDIGFGESYVSGDWDTDDLLSVLRFFARNIEEADDRRVFLSQLGRLINRITHILKPNSLKKSKENISAHYDLSNDLFKSFLDSRMQYSSAYFKNNLESLEQAQINKINSIIQSLEVDSNSKVLEIGCGWGGLAIELVKQTGCSYTGVTLSERQKEYFDKRIVEEDLSDKMTVLLQDYRLIRGSFDRIVSIEMVEAVGKKFLPIYFEKINSLLKKDGRFVMQVITIPEKRYYEYQKGCDWIQKYIFPGGHCPSLEELRKSSQTSSNLTIESIEDMGLSYAKTLEIWRETFNTKWEEVRNFGFDEKFKRIWNYYMAYCEAGFREGMVNIHQIVYSRI